jgi:hypothetical protein
MLSSRFGYINSGKFICEKCSFVGKNLLALSVHKRSCDKINLPTQEDDCVSSMNITLTPLAPPAQQVVQQKQVKAVTKKAVTPSQDK